jgi:sialate O-acetylesterase
MKILAFIGFLLLATQAIAQLSMPKVFGDHMVLQADKAVKLWGNADPGATISTSYSKQQVKATASEDGSWSIQLEAMKPNATGNALTVSDGKNEITFKDVLVGEVWFASGQSNMQWNLGQIGAKETISAADNSMIRFFQAKRTAEPTPQSDVEGKWTLSSPETAQGYSAVAYFFAKKLQGELNVPVAIVEAAWGGKPVEAFTRREALLSIPEGKGMMEKQDNAIATYDEAVARTQHEEALKTYEVQLTEWNAKPEAEREGRGPRKPRMAQNPGNRSNLPATIYNGMIHPLVGYSMRGAIWYQGESNARSVEQASDYGALFGKKIEDWRQLWGDDFRYLWVQLANFRAPVQEPGTNSGWAVVQEHQRLTLALPKTGMAVINDVGDAKNIHPRNKLDVGERLARWALADDYGKNIIKSGPLYSSHEISGGKVTATFDHIGKGLKSRDGEPLQRFEIQDAAGKWHWAEATIKGNTVVITHPAVKQATAARYAWAENPEGANLVNSEGLPTSLFTTEWQSMGSVSVGKNNLVSYQAAPLFAPVGGSKFKGSNFIHPLKTPSGFVITDSQPKDHAHHFGLWWPWKYIELDGRKILCWELQNGDGVVEAKSNKATANGLITESVYIDRKAPGGPQARLNETTEITVSDIMDAPAKGYYLDLKIDHKVAGDQPIKINKYRYSGLGFRGTALWNMETSTLLTSEGAKRPTANGEQARWIRIEGTNGKGGTAGVLMMGAPSNHSHPEKLRTWDKHYNGAIFVNFNPVMGEPWIFEPGKTYTRDYRLFVYDGSLTAAAAEQLWQKYSAKMP